MQACLLILLVCLMASPVVTASALARAPQDATSTPTTRPASFADLDRRALEGERLNVVFLGGSLTWGSNATDPQQTSYRALVGRWLHERYPNAQIVCHDAAIGGTGSRLGIYRLGRDVLARKPDLVFVDFTANDNIRTVDADSLASYEAIIRRLIQEAECPVVVVILPFKADVTVEESKLVRREAHRKLAEAYGCGIADAVGLMRERHAQGRLSLDEAWDNPSDTTHPGDLGYRIYAQAVQEGFDAAVAEALACRLPEKTLHDDRYLHISRQRLSAFTPLPAGWSVGEPSRTGAYFDMQPSRWLDHLVIAKGPDAKALALRFRGTSIDLFGEGTPTSGRYRITLDGQLVRGEHGFDAASLASHANGNVRLFEHLASGLDPDVEHTLVIEPLLDEGQELRIESLCIAGPGATVVADPAKAEN